MNIPEKIKELKSINESHRKLNGELRERIKELEAENAELTNKEDYLVAANDVKNDVDDKKNKYVRYIVNEETGEITAHGETTTIHKLETGPYIRFGKKGSFSLEKLFPKRKPKFQIALSRSLLLQFLNCLDKNDETLRFYFYGKDKQVKITSENETIKAIIMPMFVQWEDK